MRMPKVSKWNSRGSVNDFVVRGRIDGIGKSHRALVGSSHCGSDWCCSSDLLGERRSDPSRDRESIWLSRPSSMFFQFPGMFRLLIGFALSARLVMWRSYKWSE